MIDLQVANRGNMFEAVVDVGYYVSQASMNLLATKLKSNAASSSPQFCFYSLVFALSDLVRTLLQ